MGISIKVLKKRLSLMRQPQTVEKPEIQANRISGFNI